MVDQIPDAYSVWSDKVGRFGKDIPDEMVFDK